MRDIAKEFDLEAVRLFMLGAHYRNPVNFSRDMIEQATAALQRLRTAKERLDEAPVAQAPTPEDAAFLTELDGFQKAFCDAMDDDLNTADAIGVLFDMARSCNTFVSEPRGKEAVEKARALFGELCGVLGLLVHKKEEAFPQEALDMLEQRQAARKQKNWAEADRLRDALKEMGFVIEDTPQGSKLKKA